MKVVLGLKHLALKLLIGEGLSWSGHNAQGLPCTLSSVHTTAFSALPGALGECWCARYR